ncbi:hypothetical protein LTR72_001401 [Exophiala xenobiotica]|nr:hypothetical protein LTR72_001401 [Exophiala xenobiotica]KAK5295835.1 hypothetical protein LTR14_003464 [Exophiala xenobiotica]KAK5492249.1 hypothetical protein LTR55_003602 [Exophiala xenobiotica]
MATQTEDTTTSQALSTVSVPRIAIKFCTQCKWNLRAAYYAQELLQTFSTSIGEIALIPVTGGIFTVTMTHAANTTPSTSTSAPSTTDPTPDPQKQATGSVTETIIWDRKTEGGFPETKELKNRVRNIIEPGRDLGHIDRSLKKAKEPDLKNEEQSSRNTEEGASGAANQQIDGGKGNSQGKDGCEDCK